MRSKSFTHYLKVVKNEATQSDTEKEIVAIMNGENIDPMFYNIKSYGNNPKKYLEWKRTKELPTDLYDKLKHLIKLNNSEPSDVHYDFINNTLNEGLRANYEKSDKYKKLMALSPEERKKKEEARNKRWKRESDKNKAKFQAMSDKEFDNYAKEEWLKYQKKVKHSDDDIAYSEFWSELAFRHGRKVNESLNNTELDPNKTYKVSIGLAWRSDSGGGFYTTEETNVTGLSGVYSNNKNWKPGTKIKEWWKNNDTDNYSVLWNSVYNPQMSGRNERIIEITGADIIEEVNESLSNENDAPSVNSTFTKDGDTFTISKVEGNIITTDTGKMFNWKTLKNNGVIFTPKERKKPAQPAFRKWTERQWTSMIKGAAQDLSSDIGDVDTSHTHDAAESMYFSLDPGAKAYIDSQIGDGIHHLTKNQFIDFIKNEMEMYLESAKHKGFSHYLKLVNEDLVPGASFNNEPETSEPDNHGAAIDELESTLQKYGFDYEILDNYTLELRLTPSATYIIDFPVDSRVFNIYATGYENVTKDVSAYVMHYFPEIKKLSEFYPILTPGELDSLHEFLSAHYTELDSDKLNQYAETTGLTPEDLTNAWESNQIDRTVESATGSEIQDRADAINYFGKIAREGNVEMLADEYESEKRFPTIPGLLNNYITILNKYDLLDAVISSIDNNEDDYDPAGGRGLATHEKNNTQMKDFNHYLQLVKEGWMTVKGTITFRTFIQKVLWDNEITGQLSDGMWENSRPHDHWEFWCGLDSAVGEPGVTKEQGRPSKVNYNLANPELIDIVGDRMIMMAKAAKVGLDEAKCKAAEYLEGYKTAEEIIAAKANSMTREYIKEKINLFSDDEIRQIFAAQYTKSNLLADLRDMAAIMKMVNGGTYSGPYKSPKEQPTNSDGTVKASALPNGDDKDLQRVNDIVAKAGGDAYKEYQLAKNMANSITAVSKAVGRYKAALSINKPIMADIFKTKAKSLGWNG